MAMALHSSDNLRPFLVGREREQVVLADRLAGALAGRGSIVLIGGEAGIGKTALAEMLCREAAGRGVLVLVGHCYDRTETPPYGLWSDLLGRYQETAGGLADDAPPPAALAAPGEGRVVASQAVLFTQVLDWLRVITARQPVMLFLDDMHWADPASLDLLRFLARARETLPMLIVAAYRVEEVGWDDPLAALVPLLTREASALHLALVPLTVGALRAYVDGRYALTEADAAALAAYLAERAEGNPFFMTELLHALEEQDILRPDGAGWTLGAPPAVVPPLLRQVIAARLERLGSEAQRLLSVAAVIGQAVPLALWEAVSGADEEQLLDLTERAVAASVMTETGGGTAVRFAHALFRETLYEDVLIVRRRALHARIAEALLAAHAPDADLLAYHLTAAGDERAAEWLTRAGLRAQRAAAWTTAVQRFQAALALLPETDATACERGWLNFAIGRMETFFPLAAAEHLERAARLAAQSGDRPLAAITAYYRGLAEFNHGDVTGSIATMEGVVVTFRALAEDERAALRERRDWIGRALDADDGTGQLSTILAYAGRLDEARAIAEGVVAGRQDNQRHAQADAAFTLAVIAALGGQPAEARRLIRESWRAFDDLGAYDEATRSLYVEALWIHAMFPLEDAEAPGRLQNDLLRAWRKTGVSLMPHSSDDLIRLPLAGITGEWALLRAIADAVPLGSVILEIVPRSVLALVAYGQGDAARVWALVHELLPDGTATAPGETHYLTALVLLRFATRMAIDAVDLAAADDWLSAHDRWLAFGNVVIGRAEGELIRALRARAVGNTADAERHARDALAMATEPRQALVMLAAERLLGELATAAGRYAEADAHLDAALALADACGAPYERTLTLLAQAERLAAGGDAPAAGALLDLVRALATPLGAQPALARANALMARITRYLTVRRRAADGLTEREVAILRAVAAGKSNQEIAAALSITARTVERHISNIYAKTGARNRSEATLYALRNNLT